MKTIFYCLQPSAALKRNSQPEFSHLCSKEIKLSDNGNLDRNAPIEFNDMCDNVIDMILCHLQLEDLANISDTSKRLRSIAGSIFSRKHAQRLISFDVFHYSRNLSERRRKTMQEVIKIYCKQGETVRITDAKIWFKIMRNFGASIKYIRIQDNPYELDTRILSALQNMNKYVSEFCSDSLISLELHNYHYFTLNKPLTKLQEFLKKHYSFENSEALKLMPNLRTLVLYCVPSILEKHYPQLNRVELRLEKDEEVHSFVSFLRMNRQIKYLKLRLMSECKREHNDSIYSSIVENLTKLKTFKLSVMDGIKTAPHRFETVESFSIFGLLHHSGYFTFEFTNLRKLTLEDVYYYLPNWLNFILRNKKLKILKLYYISSETLLKKSDIRNLLNELPELEQINVHSFQKENYSILKDILGSEWEQNEIRGKIKFSLSSQPTYQRFKKITTIH